MDEQPNLREFLNEVSNFADEGNASVPAAAPGGVEPIGEVFEIAGSGSQIRMNAANLMALQGHKDASVALSGQVGSQIKMMVGNSWLLANVRTLRAGDNGELVAHVDFLGEGARDSSGKLSNFRRGVTRYPIPGCPVLPVNTAGPARHLRRQRGAAYRDRNGLSDRRHPRRALRRSDAGQALRGAGIDRYR